MWCVFVSVCLSLSISPTTSPNFHIPRLPEVTRLDLGSNPMTYLGEETVSMAKVTHLFMDHMSLQDLANTAVSLSPNLVHLDLSHNQLRVLQPFSAGGTKQLGENCTLSQHNQIGRAHV